jgi:N-formylglutamate deformylase
MHDEIPRLPLFISVPHAGTRMAPELRNLCILRREDILADHDAGAGDIYAPLRTHAAGFCTTDIARSLLDLNRAPDDIGGNGVVKDYTCWNVPVFRTFPDRECIRKLLARYFFPYHEKLSGAAATGAIKLGIDCHTMSVIGPPGSPDPGRERPLVCLSNGEGTCPAEWISSMAGCFASVFKGKVTINEPFRGGYITRSHAVEMPWIQLEISQTETLSNAFKSDCVLEGLKSFCHTVFGDGQ